MAGLNGATRRAGADGFRSVVFDCDSTLVSVEGIDELAAEHVDEIRALTDAAMRGEVPLEDVYGSRLDLIRPGARRVGELGSLYVDRLVADARSTVAALLWLQKDVRVVSGGLAPPVERVAHELGIATQAVAAVGIDFDAEGRYAGFDRESPLARSGGKAEVLRRWSLDRPSLIVGDGATDLEARPEVDGFVAYMGVVYREDVAAQADVVLTAESLAPVLSIAASTADRARLSQSPWGELLAKGDALLGNSGFEIRDSGFGERPRGPSAEP